MNHNAVNKILNEISTKSAFFLPFLFVSHPNPRKKVEAITGIPRIATLLTHSLTGSQPVHTRVRVQAIDFIAQKKQFGFLSLRFRTKSNKRVDAKI